MIKAGIAGLGWWGKTLVEGVADSKDIQFVAGSARNHSAIPGVPSGARPSRTLRWAGKPQNPAAGRRLLAAVPSPQQPECDLGLEGRTDSPRQVRTAARAARAPSATSAPSAPIPTNRKPISSRSGTTAGS